ncbi:hypothetical protein BGZ50_000622 [Haplosporangium sp. Z 11]|nr:hypothetical protein BGZ50_000622 [Haplosporangium sp. Z 11]
MVMLHRIRMHTVLPQTGYHSHNQTQHHLQQQQQVMFGQELSSPSLDSISGYDWDQGTTLGSNPIASALSLDLLLGMGSSPSPVMALSSASDSTPSSSGSSSDVDQSLFGMEGLASQQHQHQQEQQQQQYPLSSIPLGSFTGDYSPDASNGPTSMALSPIPSSPVQSALPQQTYYELLMAANPNEPLSQLLSTSAATMASSSFAVASSPSVLTSLTASPLESAFAALDSSLSSTPTVASTAPAASTMEIPCSEQIIASVSRSFSLEQQQTIPLTTEEIMDALSGQFPIQPLTTSVPNQSSNTTAAPTIATSTATIVSSSSAATEEDQQAAPMDHVTPLQDQSAALSAPVSSLVFGSAPDSDASILIASTLTATSLQDATPVPPDTPAIKSSDVGVPILHSTSETNPEPTSVNITVVDQACDPATDMDIDTQDLTPPLLYKSRIRSSSSSKRSKTLSMCRRSSRPQTRRYKSRPVAIADQEDDLETMERAVKHRRLSDDEASSSSSCSSPESSPPSPKTPPPLTESHQDSHGLDDTAQQEPDLDHVMRSGAGAETPMEPRELRKRTRSKVTEIVDIEGVLNLRDEGEGHAGILSHSLLPRYPTRQSARIHRRNFVRH